MNEEEINGAKASRQPYRMHLPEFVTGEEIGLGDALKRVSHAFGIRPCGGCERRAGALNGWVVFTGRTK